MRPRSILQLILLGFLVVLFPMAMAVYQAFHSLDELAIKNRNNIKTAVLVTRRSQLVAEYVTDLERSLRQYQLLKKNELLQIFYERLENLGVVLAEMKPILPETIGLAHLLPFETTVNELRITAQLVEKDPTLVPRALTLVDRLSELTSKISGANFVFADRLVKETDEIVQQFQDELFIRSVTLLPLTVLLVILFSVLIARPFRQLHKAITKLGQGDFGKTFQVNGPNDFRVLGDRLNWLGRRLQELEDQKQQFLRHMSHELKTPLAALKEGGELMEDEVPGPLTERQKEVIDIINKNIKYFQKVIENLLDYNLLRSHENLMLDDVCLPDLIREIQAFHNLTLSRKNLEIKAEGDTIFVVADKRRLTVALENILSNAINFSPKSDIIEVRWWVKNELQIEIQDHGPGVDPEEMESIFKPFYQGTARRDGPLKGSGIGLSLAKECIDAHLGTIKALSKGKGACFRISLPLNLTKDLTLKNRGQVDRPTQSSGLGGEVDPSRAHLELGSEA